MGTIALVGGEEFRPSCVPMDRVLLRMSIRQPSHVLILPTAAAHQGPHMAATNGMEYFTSLGARADAAMVLTRADADSAAFVSRIADADIVYLTGGDPRHLLDTLKDSATWAAIQAIEASGGMVAGSSAGAMVLGEWIRRGSEAWMPALGMVPHVAVLPHHDHVAPAAVAHSRAARALDPSACILGIPTATACVSHSGTEWQVLGVGVVTVYRPSGSASVVPGQIFRLA